MQRSFKNICGVQHLDYWERLKELDLYSLEWRRERYTILYIYEILSEEAFNSMYKPTFILGVVDCHAGASNIRAIARVRRLREDNLTIREPRLFNALPKHLRDQVYVTFNIFKSQIPTRNSRSTQAPELPHQSGQLQHPGPVGAEASRRIILVVAHQCDHGQK